MFKFPASMRIQAVLRSSRGTTKQLVGRAIDRPKLVAEGTTDCIEGRVLRLISTTRPMLRLVTTQLTQRVEGK
jgi:uncharacterized protein YjbJ (UPF0337 family)